MVLKRNNSSSSWFSCFGTIVAFAVLFANSPLISFVRTERDIENEPNRNGKLPLFPLKPDLRSITAKIVAGHEVLRKGLQQFLGFKDLSLGIYLNETIHIPEPFIDEYGQVITTYDKVFRFILQQYKETELQNYAIGEFDKDKLDLCSVARYLSHQTRVEDRGTIMKRMSNALGYRCHPCTPYKRRQYGNTTVPSTDGISPDISPEESLALCSTNSSKGISPNKSPVPSIPSITKTSSNKNTSSENSSAIFEEYQRKFPQLFKAVPQHDFGACKETFSEMCEYGSTCSHYAKFDLSCELIPIGEMLEIFFRTSRVTFETISIRFRPTETVIPADLLNNKRARKIKLNFKTKDVDDEEWVKMDFSFLKPLDKLRMKKIDENAFRASKHYTQEIVIENVDLSELSDLNFLSGFEHLTHLTLRNILGMEEVFPTLPAFQNLIVLDIKYVARLTELQNFPNLTNGLKVATFVGDDTYEDWDDDVVSNILDWITSSSRNTLESLNIGGHSCTQIPAQIPSFTALKYFQMYGGFVEKIKTGELSFTSPVLRLNLDSYAGIKEIEPGAFQGDFKDAMVRLIGNKLTQFEEPVFGTLVRQMATGIGEIDASDNPFDCTGSLCKLAWLIQGNRKLLGNKVIATCANATSFNELHRSGFKICP